MLTVGDMLRETREKKNISLVDIEKNIRVRVKFLEAIENNNWNGFSSKIYISGIIKNYSQYLELDPKKMLAFFRRDYERKEEVKFKTRVSSKYLTPETKKFAMMGIATLFLIFFIYFGYQVKQYLQPPTLVVLSPKSTAFKLENRILFTAKTEKDAMVTIRGERVFQDKNGVFAYDFPLNEGKNVLTIEITGANGKKITIEKTFVKNLPQ